MGKKREGKPQLKRLCSYFCLGQNELASAIGCHKSTIEQIISGKRNLTDVIAGRLLDVFPIHRDWLSGKVPGETPVGLNGKPITKKIALHVTRTLRNRKPTRATHPKRPKGSKLSGKWAAEIEGDIKMSGTSRRERQKQLRPLSRIPRRVVSVKAAEPNETPEPIDVSDIEKKEMLDNLFHLECGADDSNQFVKVFETFCCLLFRSFQSDDRQSHLMRIDGHLNKMIMESKFRLADQMTDKDIRTLRKILVAMQQIRSGKHKLNPDFFPVEDLPEHLRGQFK